MEMCTGCAAMHEGFCWQNHAQSKGDTKSKSIPGARRAMSQRDFRVSGFSKENRASLQAHKAGLTSRVRVMQDKAP